MSLETAWYSSARWVHLLRPLSLIFGLISQRRRRWLTASARGVSIPVVVVGNISVGGSGKTPLLLALIELCRSAGIRPGVISRGYGGKAVHYPLRVSATTPVAEAGDEPLMIARLSGVPLFVDPDRVAAAQALEATGEVDLILSDDGLQHYRLRRDFEFAVIDAVRGLGNAQLLPEGPLRESPDRLAEVDVVMINGEGFSYPGAQRFLLQPTELINLKTGRCIPCQPQRLGRRRVRAFAAIGNPQRFFTTLTELGFDPEPHPLPDHAAIDAAELCKEPDTPVIMTQKDAVKCRDWAPEHCWALVVNAKLTSATEAWLKQRFSDLVTAKKGEVDGP